MPYRRKKKNVWRGLGWIKERNKLECWALDGDGLASVQRGRKWVVRIGLGGNMKRPGCYIALSSSLCCIFFSFSC
jgi:hypothetical protein